MKVLRGLLIFIISFVLTFMVIGYTLTINMKSIVQEQLVGEIVKQAIVKNAEENINIDLDSVDSVFKDSDLSSIIDAAIMDYTDYVNGNISGVRSETIDKIIDFVTEHKEDLEQISGEKIDLSELQSQKVRDEITRSANESMQHMNVDKESPAITVVSTYGKIASDSFKYVVLGIMCVLVLLIGLIEWSFYKWMKPVGSSLITSGVIVSLFYVLIEVFSTFINQSIETSISIDGSKVLISGVIELVCGILMLIVYTIINKVIKNNKEISSSDITAVEEPNIPVQSTEQVIEPQESVYTPDNNWGVANEQKEDSNDIEVL